MGTTSLGLRFPEPTEPLNAGAQNIENLADDLNALLLARPRGVLGYAQALGDQTFTAETPLAGLSVSVTVAAARRIRISVDVMLTSNQATNHLAVYVKESATFLTQRQFAVTRANAGEPVQASVIVLAPLVGVHTYNVAAAVNAGAGIGSILAAPTYPGFILVEDIGPA